MKIDTWDEEIIKNTTLTFIFNFYHKTQRIENSFAKSNAVEICIAKPNALKKNRVTFTGKKKYGCIISSTFT